VDELPLSADAVVKVDPEPWSLNYEHVIAHVLADQVGLPNLATNVDVDAMEEDHQLRVFCVVCVVYAWDWQLVNFRLFFVLGCSFGLDMSPSAVTARDVHLAWIWHGVLLLF
jgi:hypothetical protein